MLRDFFDCFVGDDETVKRTMRRTGSNNQTQPSTKMKTTLALLIAAFGFTASVFAGPSIPGGNTTAPRPVSPTGCSKSKLEMISGHGRGSGPIFVSRKVNCAGQSCCAAVASCCTKKK